MLLWRARVWLRQINDDGDASLPPPAMLRAELARVTYLKGMRGGKAPVPRETEFHAAPEPCPGSPGISGGSLVELHVGTVRAASLPSVLLSSLPSQTCWGCTNTTA